MRQPFDFKRFVRLLHNTGQLVGTNLVQLMVMMQKTAASKESPFKKTVKSSSPTRVRTSTVRSVMQQIY